MSAKTRLILFLAMVSPFLLTVSVAGAQAQGRTRGGDRDGGHAGRPGGAGREGERIGGYGGQGPVIVVRGGFRGSFYDPFFYDPLWDPYPWGPYGYGTYSDDAGVRVLATPKDAEVYVDGYYAGVVRNFNGIFQRLNVEPGGHEIVHLLIHTAELHRTHVQAPVRLPSVNG